MIASKEDIELWLSRADENTEYMLVVCDRFDNDDYPVYVNKGEDIRNYVEKYSGNMQEIMEIYDLSKDLQEQLNVKRARSI